MAPLSVSASLPALPAPVSSVFRQCYAAVMEGLARRGSWRQARALVDDMDQAGLVPDARTIALLLECDGYS